MISALQLANVLETVTVSAAFIVLIFWVIRSMRVDSLRQKLFALRDEMFDFAFAGNISFNDPAYKLLRDQMNGLIRYAHQLTLFRLLISVCIRTTLGEESSLKWNNAWKDALTNLHDDKLRTEMLLFHDRAMHNALKHLVLGSPLLLSIIGMAMVFIVIGRAGRASYTNLRQLSRAASRLVLVGPLDPRKLEEEAVGA